MRAALATPPATDGDFSSPSAYDSDALPSSLSDVQSTDGGLDVLSESDFALEPEEFGPARSRRGSHHHNPGEIAPLSDIASDVDADVENGSVQGDEGGGSGSGDGDGDGDGDNDGPFDLERGTRALSLADDDETPPPLPLRGTGYRARTAMWDSHRGSRSGSSPSRSPARRKHRRPLGRTIVKKAVNSDGGKTESFYDFLFK